MKKKLFIVLSLILALTSCKSKDKDKDQALTSSLETKIEDKSSNENSKEKNKLNNKKDKEKENTKKITNQQIKRNGQYQDIYDDLENKKFFIEGGSMIESIYFYKNGYFDGVNKGGNGGYIGMGLYNGKFDIKEKLSDTSYLINLRRIDYDTNTGKEKDINFNNSNWHFKYTEALFFSNDMVGKDFVLYLPKTKFSSLDENEQINMKMLNHHISNDMINIYAIEKKQDDYKGFMTEFIKE